MATEKQIAANRQNAKKSTGPRTDYGKRRSRRNAMRHGLTAETVINVFEDPAAYRALQRAIYADYRPRSNFELQLVGRLVSLLWRLRRSTAIESGILTIQAASHRKTTVVRDKDIDRKKLNPFYELIPTLTPRAQIELDSQTNKQNNGEESSQQQPLRSDENGFNIAQSFMKISRLNGSILERLGRYEVRLWRQTLQTILLLNSLNSNSKKYIDSIQGLSDIGRGLEKRRRIYWPPFASPK